MNEIEFGRVFADEEVAALYQYRAPYPRGVFAILERLVVAPRRPRCRDRTGALARRFPPQRAKGEGYT